MSRSTRAVVSVLLLGGFTAVPAAPVPADAKPVFYYPTKVGTTWTYQDGDEEETLVLTAAEESRGATVITIAQVLADGRKSSLRKLAVSGRGVAVVESLGEPLANPDWVITQPIRPGDSLEFRDALDKYRVTRTTRGMERVRVPAGLYEALALDYEHSFSDGSSYRFTRYYAPGVGLVKVSYQGLQGPRDKVLKTFTPGKP